MKIRNGFVSNSSSSSFVIFGKQIDLESVALKDVKSGKIYIDGGCLCEGNDFFALTPEMFNFAKKSKKLQNKDWYYVHAMIESDGGMIDIPLDVPLNTKVMGLEIDQHSTSDMEELKIRYESEEDE